MLKERVFRTISQLMNVPLEEVNEHSSSENLERWDSLQHMNLVLALEEEFDTRFSDEEIVQMGDASSILDALRSKGVKA